MISKEVIESLNPNQLEQYHGAMSTLHVLGVFEYQKQIMELNLFAGNDSEDPALLAKKILDLRLRTNLLMQFAEVAEESYRILHNG
jgi:hypothetical protein